MGTKLSLPSMYTNIPKPNAAAATSARSTTPKCNILEDVALVFSTGLLLLSRWSSSLVPEVSMILGCSRGNIWGGKMFSSISRSMLESIAEG